MISKLIKGFGDENIDRFYFLDSIFDFLISHWKVVSNLCYSETREILGRISR